MSHSKYGSPSGSEENPERLNPSGPRGVCEGLSTGIFFRGLSSVSLLVRLSPVNAHLELSHSSFSGEETTGRCPDQAVSLDGQAPPQGRQLPLTSFYDMPILLSSLTAVRCHRSWPLNPGNRGGAAHKARRHFLLLDTFLGQACCEVRHFGWICDPSESSLTVCVPSSL